VGSEGGFAGGYIVGEGTPEHIATLPQNHHRALFEGRAGEMEESPYLKVNGLSWRE